MPVDITKIPDLPWAVELGSCIALMSRYGYQIDEWVPYTVARDMLAEREAEIAELKEAIRNLVELNKSSSLGKQFSDLEAIIAKSKALVAELHQTLNPGCRLATILPPVERPPFFVNYDDDEN